MKVFEPANIGSLRLPNRLLRSATFEGLCDTSGFPRPSYAAFYRKLARQGLGAVITGFASVSSEGKAMQPGQACITTEHHAAAFRPTTEAVHEQGGTLIMQLAHAGLQTTPGAVGGRVYAPSARRGSPFAVWRYFNSRAHALSTSEVERVIADFAEAACRAREAGFDGVQLHAAHGYLLHQFLEPAFNRREDGFGIDAKTGVGTALLGRVIQAVRDRAGSDYPLLVKVSAGRAAAGPNGLHAAETTRFEHLLEFLENQHVDAIEVSYGTMEKAFSIFRGQSIPIEAVLNHNPRYGVPHGIRRWVFQHVGLPLLKRQFPPYAPMYNLPHAKTARRLTTVPIICVGGFRTGAQIRHAIEAVGIDFVSLCRPILCEPDFALKLAVSPDYASACRNCNECAVMCDSGRPTHCYARSFSDASLKTDVQQHAYET